MIVEVTVIIIVFSAGVAIGYYIKRHRQRLILPLSTAFAVFMSSCLY